MHSLQERLLLGQVDRSNADIRTHGEAVYDTTEEEDLIRLPCRLKDNLRLLALLGRENLVSFCRKLFVSYFLSTEGNICH